MDWPVIKNKMGHLNSRLIWHKHAESFFNTAGSVLEIGPQGYPSYYEKILKERNPSLQYSVLDVRTGFISGAENNPDFILSEDPLHYPLPDNSFDIVFSDQVLAHVEYFWDWYGELARITRPGGYLITVNSQSYPSCPSPIDAWRVHSDGMKSLNKYHGLETVLSLTESVEMEKFGIPLKPGYYFAGASVQNPVKDAPDNYFRANMLKKRWNSIIGKIPLLRAFLLNPVQVSFDTVTVARKPLIAGTE